MATALNFSVSPQRVVIVMDTMALHPDTKRPGRYATKFFVLQHLNGVMCGTGNWQFVLSWYLMLQTDVLALDIDEVNKYAPDSLRQMAQVYGLGEGNTATIYHFGLSLRDDVYRGYAYRSTDNFTPVVFNDGNGVKPPVDNWVPSFNSVEAMVETVKQQKIDDERLPLSQRVGIGGDIHRVVLEAGIIVVDTLARFTDYGDNFREMLEHA